MKFCDTGSMNSYGRSGATIYNVSKDRELDISKNTPYTARQVGGLSNVINYEHDMLPYPGNFIGQLNHT